MKLPNKITLSMYVLGLLVAITGYLKYTFSINGVGNSYTWLWIFVGLQIMFNGWVYNLFKKKTEQIEQLDFKLDDMQTYLLERLK